MSEEEPKENREAMLVAFRGSLAYDVYQEFQRLKGDDGLLAFYLAWWQHGLTRESIEGSAEEAGFPRAQGAGLAGHTAVRWLYQALGHDDVVAIAEITRLFFEGIKTDMKSEDEGTRTKCYATWNLWMKTNATRVDAQLARAERLKRAAVEPKKEEEREVTAEDLCRYLAAIWREVEGQGIDPRSILAKEKGLKYPVPVTVPAIPAPSAPSVRVIEVPTPVKN